MSRPALLLACVVLLAGADTPPGDRGVGIEIVYPPKAFTANGGLIHDITKPPYNAKGDGTTDDTAAFVAMMDAVRDNLEAMRQKRIPWGTGPSFFYVPNGTYLVSDSIVCSREVKDGFAGLHLIGQDRRRTVIRLKDRSPGFEAGRIKPLLSYSRDPEHHQCGVAWGNEVRNLTLDTGSGNPGAVGLLFLGANACSLDNLTVRSGDGQGHAGLYFPTWAVQGYFDDITVQGFDYGIEIPQAAETNPSLEWLTLRDQRKAGVHIGQANPCLRKVLSENTVPAVQITGAAGSAVLLDSRLAKGGREAAAVVVDAAAAQAFVRDVEVSGYGAAVDAVDALARRAVRTPFPAGTTAKASFATTADGGPDRLLDGNPDSFLAGAPNSCKAPREPVWVDIAFPAPVADLAGVEIGGAEKFGNYYAKELEVWIDSDGNGTFDTPVAHIAGLGGGGKQACILDFAGRIPKASGLRLLVAEQNLTGSKRAFHMNGLGLLCDPTGAALTPTPADDAAKRVEALRAGNAPELAVVGKSGPARVRLPAGRIEEWVYGAPVRLSGEAKRSMRLPIEEVPPPSWEKDPAAWATPEDAQGDDQTRIQAAMNAGKPNVMLTRDRYEYKAAIAIPAGVRRIEMHNANPRGPALVVAEASDQPLWIHHPGNRVVLELRAPRPVFVRFGDTEPDVVTDRPVTLQLMAIANTGPRPRFCPANARIFGRCLNNENKGTAQFPVDGGRMWVFGFKTEGPTESFAVRNGGILEVLGGYRNNSMKDQGKPLILNEDAQVCFVGFCNMANVFQEAIWERRGGELRKLGKDALPARSSYTGNYFIPLYLGFDPATVAAALKP